jgi:type II secretory pathway pseudopilin PulG
MKSDRAEFSLLERLTVIGIILCLLAVYAENVLSAVRQSEERRVDAAAVEYKALRSTYAAMYRVPPRPAAAYGAPAQ